MSFKQALESVIAHYADFTGRARRSEYWYFVLANFILSTVLGRLADRSTFFNVFFIIYQIAVFLPGLSVLWRRLHDIGRSGAYAFIFLIPLLGPILLLIRLVTDSTPGSNRFGPNPKTNARNNDFFGQENTF